MVLSNKQIKERIQKGELLIEGIDPEKISSSTIDLHLGNEITSFKYSDHSLISPGYDDPVKYERLLSEGGRAIIRDYTDTYIISKPFVIHPLDFVLCSVNEKITMPWDLLGRIEPVENITKIGVIVNSLTGSIKPGFTGKPVLAVTNIGKIPARISPGMLICQLIFEEVK